MGAGCLLLLAGGCGVKTPVMPPDVQLPAAVSRVDAFVRGAEFLLTWEAPDEKAHAEIAAYKVFREDPAVRLRNECRCPEFEEIAALDPGAERAAPTAANRYILRTAVDSAWAGKTYRYVVVPIGKAGYAGHESRAITIRWLAAPPPPPAPAAEGQDRAVTLRWPVADDPAVRLRYNIYRKAQGASDPLYPVNRRPVTGPEYVDRGLQNGVAYVYTMRSTRSIEAPWVESDAGRAVVVTPLDRIPPAPPQGLEAIPGPGFIRLVWEENREDDLRGYRIYRREGARGVPRVIGEVAQPVSLFADGEIRDGVVYHYHITALDTAPTPNESAPSRAVRMIAHGR